MDKMEKELIDIGGNLNLYTSRPPSHYINDKTRKGILKFVMFSILILILFIIQTNQISSIGITPGRTSINFEPGLQQEVSFSVVNTEHKDMSVVFFVNGNLNGSITLKQAYIKFSSTEESKSFSYMVNLPQKFEKPGRYEAEVVALEMPSDLELAGAFIGATVSVATQIYVYAPYPNKYAEAELNVFDSGDKKVFLIPIDNRGKLDIVSAKGVIDIYTKLNEKIATIETDSVPINSLTRGEVSAEWVSNVNPGKYLAIATVIYDNEVIKLEKEFEVGEMVLEINSLYVNDFSLGEIAKFNALVENKWSNDLKDVYLNVLVYNNEGEVMADFKSPTYDIASLSKKEMVAYWDTGGVKQGTYDGKIILKFGEKTTERKIQLKISDSNIEIYGVTGLVSVKGKGSSLNINNILMILVVVLVVANIVWFVIIRKFMKKRNKKTQN